MESFIQFVESVDINIEHDILTMYRDNHRYKIKNISEITGLSIGRIYRILEKYGIHPHRQNSKEFRDLVTHYAQMGVPTQKIAELTGYSKRHVYNILRS